MRHSELHPRCLRGPRAAMTRRAAFAFDLSRRGLCDLASPVPAFCFSTSRLAARPFRPRIAPALPISAAPLLSLCRPRCISPPFSVSLSALSPLISPCALLSCRMCNRLHSPRPATSCLSDLKAHDFDDRLCVHRLSPRSLTLPAPLVRPRTRHTSLLAHHVPARFRCTPSQLSLPPSLSSRSILAHHVPFVPARFMHARHCSSPFLPLSLRAPRSCFDSCTPSPPPSLSLSSCRGAIRRSTRRTTST